MPVKCLQSAPRVLEAHAESLVRVKPAQAASCIFCLHGRHGTVLNPPVALELKPWLRACESGSSGPSQKNIYMYVYIIEALAQTHNHTYAQLQASHMALWS